MDMTFSTIPVFGGEFRRLYRENQLAYIVSDHENTTNHPICDITVEYEYVITLLNMKF